MRKMVTILVMIVFCSCNLHERNRPLNVPDDAVWIGGVDGGCWIVLNLVSSEKLEATIFYEDGDLWEQGLFRKKNKCTIHQLRIEDISSFDGKHLNTNKGCVFEKID